MSSVFDSIMAGLSEAVDDARNNGSKLTRRTVTVVPVKEYNAEQVKAIRCSTGMSQKIFAAYLGVSDKTVEAWEAGTNHPAGAASRILSMIEMDRDFINRYPFVKANQC